MREVALVSLVVIVAATACAPQAAQQSPELAAMTERWEEALNSGKVEAVAALYSEDARLLPRPTAEPAVASFAEVGGLLVARMRWANESRGGMRVLAVDRHISATVCLNSALAWARCVATLLPLEEQPWVPMQRKRVSR